MNPTFNGPTIMDRNTILFELSIPVPIEQTWKALTEKQELDQWFFRSAKIDFKVGTLFTFQTGWEGWIEEFLALSHIQYNTSKDSFTRFETRANSGNSLFRLIDKFHPTALCPENLPPVPGIPDHILRNQPGGIGTHWVGIVAGWHKIIDALQNHLCGTKSQLDQIELCLHYDNFLTQYWKSQKN